MKPRLLANENFPAPSVRFVAGLLESDSELEGHFVVVDEAGLRKRPLPEKKSVRG